MICNFSPKQKVSDDVDGIQQGLAFCLGVIGVDDLNGVLHPARADLRHLMDQLRGVRHPVLTIKVLSDEDYLRCRKTREDGGPKGIDINKDTNLLVVTCENKPLAFFDLTSILESARVKSGLVGHRLACVRFVCRRSEVE